jgi:hypothetical protein
LASGCPGWLVAANRSEYLTLIAIQNRTDDSVDFFIANDLEAILLDLIRTMDGVSEIQGDRLASFALCEMRSAWCCVMGVCGCYFFFGMQRIGAKPLQSE